MPKSARRVFFELAFWSSLTTVLGWAPEFFVILVDRACAADEAPSPALLNFKHAFNTGPWVLVPTLVVFGLLVWRSSLPALAHRSIRRRVLVVGSALALQGALCFGAVVLTLELDPHWLFGQTVPTVRKPSPDGRRTAWAGRECFFGCTDVVYVQEEGALKMKKVISRPSPKDPDQRLEPTWSADSKAVSLEGPTLGE